MKEKGFTLIELLAVIVILAIIALIAVPIVLNIINSARESAKERSRDLYAKAVQNAVLKEQLNGDTIKDGHYEKVSDTSICRFEYDVPTEDCVTVEVDGEKPFRYTMEILDGKITSQTIKLKTSDPTYTKVGNGPWTKSGETSTTEEPSNNEEEYIQVYVPDYYAYGYFGNASIATPPSNPVDTPPQGYSYYLGYKIDDYENMFSEIYSCFVRNGNEYCLKGNFTSNDVYLTNQSILNDAFGDIENACSLRNYSDGECYRCSADGIKVATCLGNGSAETEDLLGTICRASRDIFGCAYMG